MSIAVPDYIQPHIAEMVSIMENEAIYRENLAVILRLAPKPDGNQWCVLYGENLQEGVAGFGDTPWQAMQAFHAAMLSEQLPTKRPSGDHSP